MARLSPLILTLWLGVQLAVAQPVPAGAWKLPPLDANMEGDFSTGLLPGAPALHWSVTMNVPRPRERAIGFALDGPGTRVRGEATLDPKGDGTWRLTETQFDLAAWWQMFAPKYFPALAGAVVTGTVVLSGGGTVNGGQFAGRAEIEVRDAAIADPAKAWSLTGLSLRVMLGRLPDLAVDEPVRLRFREAAVADIVFRDGAIDFTLDAANVVRVASAACAVLGGRIALTPFSAGALETTREWFITLHLSPPQPNRILSVF